MDAPARARTQVEELVRLDASPAWLLPLREAGILALQLGEIELARAALEQLKRIAMEFPSTHTTGARAHLEGALLGAMGDSRAGTVLGEARGLRDDPMTGYSVARWQMSQNDYTGALVTLETLEERRGWILRHYFPPLVAICRLLRAKCLVRMSRPDALRLYRQVLRHWGRQDRYGMVLQAKQEHDRLISNSH